MGFWSAIGKGIQAVGDFLGGGTGSLLGGAVQAGASMYNTNQQVQMNADNLAYQREVNAQNQYNLENSYQIAAKDMEAAGLSKALIGGGASGSPQVAYQGSAPQSSMGSVLANTFANIAELKNRKKELDILQQNADTSEKQAETADKKVEYEHEDAVADREQRNEQFNLSHTLKELEVSQNYKHSQEILAESKRQFDLEHEEDIRQFNYEMQQNDKQFWAKLQNEMSQFDKDYKQTQVWQDLQYELALKRHEFDVSSFFESEKNKIYISGKENESKILASLLGVVGSIFRAF